MASAGDVIYDGKIINAADIVELFNSCATNDVIASVVENLGSNIVPMKWIRSNTPFGAACNAVCYGHGRFIAAGDSTETFYSSDGNNWTAGGELPGAPCESICYGNGKFFAACDSYIAYSPNGTNWTPVSMDNFYPRSISYGNGKYVAAGHGSDSTLYYSTNGTTWENLYEGDPYQSVCYGGGRFVAVGENGLVKYADISDIRNWRSASFSSLNIKRVCYGNGKFVAGTVDGELYYSTNAESWTLASGSMSSITDICYGNGKFVATDNGGALYSTDGNIWTRADAEMGAKCVGYGNGRFVMIEYLAYYSCA